MPSKDSRVFSASGCGERRSGQPLALDFHLELAGGVLQGVVGGVVRAEFGIEIAQNSDADGVAHGIDCTRGVSGLRGMTRFVG